MMPMYYEMCNMFVERNKIEFLIDYNNHIIKISQYFLWNYDRQRCFSPWAVKGLIWPMKSFSFIDISVPKYVCSYYNRPLSPRRR